MAVSLTPYLHFGTDARAALEFYRSIFGGETQLATFAAFGVSADPAEADLVMHGFLRTDSGLELMASDTPSHMTPPAGTSVSLSLSGFGVDEATLRGYWDKLREGAREIGAELGPAPWGASFGQLTDRFGVIWLVNIDPGEPQG
ncbi:MAG: VOC family protein [Actinobacteria bacterium]|nr:VOC family protein [Actinomycetota bacterium]MCG2797533.1 VOC family protein [Cellulomonas sp.]